MINLGIIGGGQLSYMLCESSIKLDSHINNIYIFSDKKDIPCNYLINNKIHIFYGEYNKENIQNFSKNCDIITYEFEDINLELFKDINIKIYPRLDLLKIIQDKYIQKLYLLDNNISVGPFKELNNINDLYDFIDEYNYPVFLKKRKGSFDGRGNIMIKNRDDIDSLNININEYYVEDFINFDCELSVCGCKKDEEIICYDPVMNKHKDSILIKTEYNKDLFTDDIINKTKEIYKEILKIFDTKGVICVEFFKVDNKIYVNEMALRVHNTYHISIDCCNISQFDIHIRSILGLNIIKPVFMYNSIMYNIISNLQNIDDIFKLIGENKYIFVKKYFKKELGKRKIGHVNIIL